MTGSVRRNVDRVEDRIRFGGDAQVDDRNVIITPMNPMLTDSFLLLSEDWFSTTGFQWHPHRGLETVTLVLDGVLEHGDSLGNAGALTTGDIQWMTAGTRTTRGCAMTDCTGKIVIVTGCPVASAPPSRAASALVVPQFA